jgi:CheR methyltransferase, all-alpha domain
MNTTVSFPGVAGTGVGSGARTGSISTADFMVIADVVRARSGIVLGLDKAYLVESRLEPIVRDRYRSGLSEIAARLRAYPNDALAHDIVEAITTNETLSIRPRSRCASGPPRPRPGKSAIRSR